MKPLLILCAAGALQSLAALPEEASTANPQAVETKAVPPGDETGSVRGLVIYDGDPPKPKPDLQPKAEERKGCDHDGATIDTRNRSLLIDAKTKGVANVVLTIEVKGVEPAVPEDPIALDQLNCRFEPHVQIVPVGAKLRFGNSDGTNHNVHTYARKNSNINNNIAGGSSYAMSLTKAETFEIKCDIHPWMNSWVVVTDASHYALSAADGSFEIAGLPPGSYKVSWWHETLGKGKAEVTVEAGQVAELELPVKKAAKKKGRRR